MNDNWFANTPKLTTVMFIENQIEEISANNLHNFRGIRKHLSDQIGIDFYFDSNKIRKIHLDAFKGIPIISNLNLRHNTLKRFPEKLFEEIIEGLDIAYNDFSCTPKELFNATGKYNP